MTFAEQSGDGAQALSINQLLDALGGDTVVSGCAPSAGTGNLEVDIASGTARVSGSNVSVSSGTVTLSSGSANPRKDLIYVDSSGNLQSAEGTAASAEPSGSVRFATYKPAPPDSTSITGAVVAEVWVAANKSDSFQSADINDRRILTDNLDPRTNSLATDAVDFEGLTPDYRLAEFKAATVSSNQSVASTSFTDTLALRGATLPSEIPSGATLHGRLLVRVDAPSSETITVRGRLWDDGADAWRVVTGEATSASGATDAVLDTGWSDISGNISNPSNVHNFAWVQAKTSSGGTGTVEHRNPSLELAGVV